MGKGIKQMAVLALQFLQMTINIVLSKEQLSVSRNLSYGI